MATKTYVIMVETPHGVAFISHSAYRKDDPNTRDIQACGEFNRAVKYLEVEVDHLLVDLEFYVSTGQLPFKNIEVISATLH